MAERYRKGEKIESLFQFMTEYTFNNPVYWQPVNRHGKVRKKPKFLAMKFIENWPLRVIKQNIERGWLYKAVRIEKE